MSAEVAAAIHALAQANPFAGGVAIVVFAMIAGLVLFGRVNHAFQDVNEEKRKGTFQQQLLDAMASMRAREIEMQAEIAALRADNARLAVALTDQKYAVEMLRQQTRRLIDLLRDVRDGKTSPGAIALPEAPV